MLSRFTDLSVTARNSSFVYKGKPVDMRQVGHDLNVDYALEGSVRKEADQIRITAQLVDTKTGEHVWAEHYDKAGNDPSALQDEATDEDRRRDNRRLRCYQEGSVSRRLGQGYGKPKRIRLLSSHPRSYQHRLASKEATDRAARIAKEGLAKYPDSNLAQDAARVGSLPDCLELLFRRYSGRLSIRLGS